MDNTEKRFKELVDELKTFAYNQKNAEIRTAEIYYKAYTEAIDHVMRAYIEARGEGNEN